MQRIANSALHPSRGQRIKFVRVRDASCCRTTGNPIRAASYGNSGARPMLVRCAGGDHGFSLDNNGPNMKRFFIPLAVGLFVAPACHADSIFNCTTGSGVSFQSMPCMVVAVNDVALPPLVRGGVRSTEYDEAPVAAPVPAVPASLLPGPQAHLIKAVAHPVAGPAAPGVLPANHDVINSRRDQLQAGMSDLQVLNNRRWGKPQRITRDRDARAWHEYWRYETGANGGTQLHFVNGTLASIDNIVPPATIESMVSVAMIKE